MTETNGKELVILGLLSGEHLLTTVTEHQGSYICENILHIVGDVDEKNGQMRIGFAPYMPYANQESGVAIPTNIAILAVPNDELKEHYNQHFGLIITPTSKKIILS